MLSADYNNCELNNRLSAHPVPRRQQVHHQGTSRLTHQTVCMKTCSGVGTNLDHVLDHVADTAYFDCCKQIQLTSEQAR